MDKLDLNHGYNWDPLTRRCRGCGMTEIEYHAGKNAKRNQMMKQPKVLLATITAEQTRFYEYYDSIDRLLLPPGTAKSQVHSSSPARNRNVVINTALKTDFTHIFFTDDDHVYPPDTVLRLLSHDKDIISGTYCMKFAPFPIIAFDAVDSIGQSKFTDMNQYGPHELVEVVALPAGCLLVKMEVFRTIAGPWFTLGQIWKDGWGDDLWFCKIAREAGYKMYIDTSVRVGHLTKCILTPQYDAEGKQWIIEQKINSDLALDVMTPDQVKIS